MKVLFVTFYLLLFFSCVAQPEQSYQEGFFQYETGEVHYLDFGGEGLPVIFIPSNDRTAFTFKNFAPRFTNEFQVYALTFPGSGKSEGEPNLAFMNFDLKADIVIGLLDHLNINRAVIIDRHFHVPVYLAERYPVRIAGLVMMNGYPPDPYSFYLDEILAKDYTQILEMTERWNQTLVDQMPEINFEPKYVKSSWKIEVPTLMLRHKLNEPYWKRDYQGTIETAQWAVKEPAEFPDEISRTYFQGLASDTILQVGVKNFYKTIIQEYYEKTSKDFLEAFGEHLEIHCLNGEHDYGYYHYLEAPELIEHSIREFLRKIEGREKQQR